MYCQNGLSTDVNLGFPSFEPLYDKVFTLSFFVLTQSPIWLQWKDTYLEKWSVTCFCSNNQNNGVSCHPCPAVSSDDPLQRSVLAEFDLSVRNQKPNVDKAKILNSPYYQSLLRVSWNLIEAEILHSPDSFDMGYDIQQVCSLKFLKKILRKSSLESCCVVP